MGWSVQLRHYQETSGLSVRRLAKLAGMPHTTLVGWLEEDRHGQPVVARHLRLMQALAEMYVEDVSTRRVAGIISNPPNTRTLLTMMLSHC